MLGSDFSKLNQSWKRWPVRDCGLTSGVVGGLGTVCLFVWLFMNGIRIATQRLVFRIFVAAKLSDLNMFFLLVKYHPTFACAQAVVGMDHDGKSMVMMPIHQSQTCSTHRNAPPLPPQLSRHAFEKHEKHVDEKTSSWRISPPPRHAHYGV